MDKKAKMEGGFAYQNTGKIENCYAAVKIGTQKSENAGFIYDNKGEALLCFTRSMVRGRKRRSENKKKKDGFTSVNSGTVSRCFFLVNKEKALKQYRDAALGRTVEAAEPKQIGEELAWNYDVFEPKNASEMDFLAENWHSSAATEDPGKERTGQEWLEYDYDVPDTELEWDYEVSETESGSETDFSAKKRRSPAARDLGKNREKIEIRTKDELLDFIDRVNQGDPQAVNAHCELFTDLDFRGKTIPSIGFDRQHPFCGIFDGGGYKIKGFVLQGKGMAETAFFGVLKGSVCNLSIDCIVKGDDCPLAAGFCAVNDGDIRCCEALVEIKAKRYVGLFVGENNGLIERCCVSGKSHGAFLLWIWPSLPALILVTEILLNPPVPPEDYVPVMVDPSIIPNVIVEKEERTNENKASYEVPRTLKIDAATLTAKSEPYVIQNPNRGGNYDFVAVLYMQDSRGKDVEVYRSGRIPVGYHIENLTIEPPGETALSAGLYEAKMEFFFYHHSTGEKGMVNSTVPMTIEIE